MGILRLPASVSIMPYEPVEVLKVPSRVLTLLSFPAVRRLGKYTIHRHFLTGLKVLLPDVESLDVYHHIWFRQDYEKVAKPHEGDIVIDVGAHVGLFTLRCLKCHKVSFVVAIEPHPLNAKLLRANLALNKLKRESTVVEAALGRREGMGELYVLMRRANTPSSMTSVNTKEDPPSGSGSPQRTSSSTSFILSVSIS